MSARNCLLLLVLCLLVLFLAPTLVSAGGSENPPAGAPWQRDFLKAQKQALEEGKPILFYFTKTY